MSRLRAAWSAITSPVSRPGGWVAVPVALGVALLIVLTVALLLRERSAAAGRAVVPDTGPVLAGAAPPADGSAGPPAVSLTPAAATHPRAEDVRALVQRSLDARNRGDYETWSSTIAGRPSTPEPDFVRESRDQRTGSVVLRRIDPVADDDLVVPTVLITTQSLADAPADVAAPRLCWQISLVVVGQDPARLVEPRPGSVLRIPC